MSTCVPGIDWYGSSRVLVLQYGRWSGWVVGEEGDELSVWADVVLVERPAGDSGEAHREFVEVVGAGGVASDAGEVGELLHDADDAAARRGCQVVLGQDSGISFDDPLVDVVELEDLAEPVGEAGQHGGSRCERDQDGKERWVVDEQRDLGSPRQRRGVPAAQQAGRLGWRGRSRPRPVPGTSWCRARSTR